MSRTYQTVGIILKSMAMGEADRLLTILSPEHGLIKAIAPGSRKPKSKLGGRTALFVVNQMLLLSGRSLDKLLQADVQESFPALSQQLGKLTTAQYWAELTLYQSMSHTPEPQLYQLLNQLLKQLETCIDSEILYLLLEGISQLLHHAGINPQLHYCGRSQTPMSPILFKTGKGVYFSYDDGGIVLGEALDSELNFKKQQSEGAKTNYTRTDSYPPQPLPQKRSHSSGQLHRLTLTQWGILNAISPDNGSMPAKNPREFGIKQWLAVEKILRGYAQHHFDCSIRSASLVDSVFTN